MKATIEVIVTLKVKAQVSNQPEADALRAKIQHAVDGEIQNLYKPITITGKQFTPEVVVVSSVPFMEFKW